MPTLGDRLGRITRLKVRLFSPAARTSGTQAQGATAGDVLGRAWSLLTWRHLACAFRCAFARFVRR